MIRHPLLIAYITVALPKSFLSRLGKKEEMIERNGLVAKRAI
jgi:hypothetical protein